MLEPGTLVDGKYRIREVIGKGGMSTVFLAVDLRLRKSWAIKEIRKAGNPVFSRENAAGEQETVFSGLILEADLMKRLDHPALPRIVDILETPESVIIVMDYISGKTLKDLVQSGEKCAEKDVLRFGIELADALVYLHSMDPPIIYRDMKPANIMLKPDGHVTLVDFGISREYKTEKSGDTVVLGTRGYAPPEQYMGHTDARSDIYALGMTMMYLLSGKEPDGGSGERIRKRIPGISEEMEIILEKCTARDPDARYQTAEALLEVLKDPKKLTAAYKRKQKRRKNRGRRRILFGIALIILSFYVGSMAEKQKERAYARLLAERTPDAYFRAIELLPDRFYEAPEGTDTDAYHALMAHFLTHEASLSELLAFGSALDKLDSKARSGDGSLYLTAGKLVLLDESLSFKSRAAYALPFFDKAVHQTDIAHEEKTARAFYRMTKLLSDDRVFESSDRSAYTEVLSEVEALLGDVSDGTNTPSEFDRAVLAYGSLLFLSDRLRFLRAQDIPEDTVISIAETAYLSLSETRSRLPNVVKMRDTGKNIYENLKEELKSGIGTF